MEIEGTYLSDRPDLASAIERLSERVWPPFLLHATIRGWRELFGRLAGHQILFLDRDGGRLVAAGHTVPIAWDGTVGDLPRTIEECVQRALDRDQVDREQVDREQVDEGGAHAARPAGALCAVAAMVDPSARGRGLSRMLVEAMRGHAGTLGLPSLIAPVRPIWKDRFPLIPLDRYAEWRRPDGAPFDPWIRVHRSLGAQTLGVAPATLEVRGTVADWERWTGLAFPGSGAYCVPGALQPVEIDREADRGIYQDPNLWMRHGSSTRSGP
ncbi:MAG: hypothetical protein ACE15D_01420 [Candidatus Eisenbacteria bacterium]|nr:hypothetical protein [Candidatus Eisenbacteria bacterium]